MKRRQFIKAGSLLALSPMLAHAKAEEKFSPFTQTLPLPKLATHRIRNGIKTFELTAREGETEFFKGVMTDTYGVNTDFLGETIRVHQGDKVQITVKNALGETTTLHWHGLEAPGISDGGSHSMTGSATC